MHLLFFILKEAAPGMPSLFFPIITLVIYSPEKKKKCLLKMRGT
jgi:hypothetical protein